MNETASVYIPPVNLDDYSQFRRFARDAALVVCDHEYVLSPFSDDTEHLKRLIVTALGVKRNGVPLTFRYVLDHEEATRKFSLLSPSDALKRMASDVVEDLQHNGNLIYGTVPLEPSLGELLTARS